MNRIYLKGLLMTVAMTTMAGCQQTKKVTEQEVETTPKVAVNTSTAREGAIATIVEFTGNIEPYQQNNIAPALAVRISDILVEVGDKVQKGQLLVTMDKNQYNQTAVQLENLKSNFSRMESVYQAGGISKQELDQTATQLRVMQETISNLEENIELRSPIDGIVTGRYYDAGDIFSMSPNASGSAAILTVMQINPLKVNVDISEKYYPQVKKGMPVELVSEVYPGQTFTGKVSLIYPSINTDTHTFTTEVTIPNNEGLLRPGMFSRTIFNFKEETGVLVNDLAVQKQIGTNERYVFVIKDGKAQRRIIEQGRHIDSEYHIISGVEVGEDVVISGISKLVDQTEVEVKN